MVTPAVLAGFGAAQPGTAVHQDELWHRYFAGHFGGSTGARRVFFNAGVATRHTAVNPVLEDVSEWTTAQRMRRYAAEAPPLGRDAVTGALAAAGLSPTEVGLLAVASCTGYTTPGLDIRLAAELGMSTGVQRLCIGHMGCYAALPGLGAVADFVACRGRPGVLLCLELPSLHLQPATRDLAQVVAHALFSDAAVAVAVRPGEEPASAGPASPGRSADGPAGLASSAGGPAGRTGVACRTGPAGSAAPAPALLDLVARTDPATGDHMTWQITDQGFRMGLSPRVADVLAGHVADTVGKLLARHGLTTADVQGWAVHPGGPRILEVVESELGLPADALRFSRAVLRDRGNCSSATVLMVLASLLRRGDVPPGGHLVAMAFGPGLTLYAALLQV